MSRTINSQLRGFIRLADQGFTLPCFGTGDRPNTWYAARSFPEGDHLGTISALEVLIHDEIELIPANQVREVSIGDPWIDVFLWHGQPIVGRPREIWTAISSRAAEVAADAPLSLLDLAMDVEAPGWPVLATQCFDFVREKHGSGSALAWRQDIYFRRNALLAVRRRLRETSASTIRQLEVVEAGNQLELLDPSTAVPDLQTVANDLEADLLRIAQPFGFAVAPIATRESGPRSAPTDALGGSRSQRDILIVALGPRAEEIARHIHQPDWTLGGASYRLREIADGVLPLPNDGPELVVAVGGMPASEQEFGAVVVLADDERSADLLHPATALRIAGLERIPLRLLAPALPVDRPSAVLARPSVLKGHFHALIDTSVARSPSWSGNPWRALDRRIADTILGAAIIAASLDPITEALTSVALQEREAPILTFDLNVRGPAEPPYGVSSESTGLADPSADIHTILRCEFLPRWRAQHPKWAGRSVAELRRHDTQTIPKFLTAAALRAADGATRESARQGGEIPSSLTSQLRYPEFAGSLSAGGGVGTPIAIIAETPVLTTIRAADRVGWRIARYTDAEFIAAALLDNKSKMLPSELGLPALQRYSGNRGLATRGVDPRDFIELDADLTTRVRQQAPALAPELRRFRATFGPNLSTDNRHLLPTSAVAQWMEQHGRSQRQLLADLQRLRHGKPRTPKRPADLRVAWSPARDERFILADGPIPVLIDELQPGLVPAQSLFIVDGDAAVPTLFGSRIFQVWARATTTRSTSWMSRFSVTKTFETFPISDAFQIVRRRGHAPSLHFAEEGLLSSAAKTWWSSLAGSSPANASISRAMPLALDPALENEIFGSYGLQPKIDDATILEHLIERNRS